MVKEFQPVRLLRDVVADNSRRGLPDHTHSKGTRGVVVDLRDGDQHCMVEVDGPADVLTVVLADLEGLDDLTEH